MKNGRLKYFFLMILLVLIISVLYKSFFSFKKPNTMKEKYNNQQNPFIVSKDSTKIVWNRALAFLKKREHTLIGGNVQINDSVIYMPYYNDYHKGASLKIERKTILDSVIFTIHVWNSTKPNEMGAKEIALYMNKGIDRLQ